MDTHARHDESIARDGDDPAPIGDPDPGKLERGRVADAREQAQRAHHVLDLAGAPGCRTVDAELPR